MFKIAFRNVLRNARRSLITASAVAVGAAALILFGEYNALVMVGMETGVVQSFGHLSVFKKGYFDFGSGRPLDYSISGYRAVLKLIENDPVLKPMVRVVTPSVSIYGIAGNTALDKSKTFFGSGFIPSDRDRMLSWDEYGVRRGGAASLSGLKNGETDHAIVGAGMARVLGLCKPLKLTNCPAAVDRDGRPVNPPAGPPHLQLLGSAGGAPNIVSVTVNGARTLGAKEMDDSYVGLNLPTAQRLLFGSGEAMVSSVVVQLNRTEDMAAARARLDALFREHKLDLEVRDFREMMPIVVQTTGFFQVLFGFLALILAIIVLFTVANTMGMSVMERTSEIGTARAMGVRRSGVHRQFLLEGAILGVLGATLGLVVAVLLAYLINHSGISYTPPGNAASVPLAVRTSHNEILLIAVWTALVIVATVAALVPANRAARMKVVDALRHV